MLFSSLYYFLTKCGLDRQTNREGERDRDREREREESVCVCVCWREKINIEKRAIFIAMGKKILWTESM